MNMALFGFMGVGKTAVGKILAVTKEYSALDGQVIACGGGTVIDPQNLVNLRRSSRMVLLTAEPEVILKRTEAEKDVRPLLNVDDRLGKIRNLLSKRWSSYVEAADIIIDTSEYTPQIVVSIIIENLE
jgi:shikimate kinase